MNDIEKELRDRCDKMSFMLGMAWSMLNESRLTMKVNGIEDPISMNCFEDFTNNIEEVFYK